MKKLRLGVNGEFARGSGSFYDAITFRTVWIEIPLDIWGFAYLYFVSFYQPLVMDNLLKKQEQGGRRHRSFLKRTKRTLSEFPDIQYNVGWIPKVFENIPERKYRFVHIDVDLYEPTYASVEYFYPRLVSGGVFRYPNNIFLTIPNRMW